MVSVALVDIGQGEKCKVAIPTHFIRSFTFGDLWSFRSGASVTYVKSAYGVSRLIDLRAGNGGGASAAARFFVHIEYLGVMYTLGVSALGSLKDLAFTPLRHKNSRGFVGACFDEYPVLLLSPKSLMKGLVLS